MSDAFHGAGDRSPDVTGVMPTSSSSDASLQWGRGLLPGCDASAGVHPAAEGSFNGAGDRSPDVTAGRYKAAGNPVASMGPGIAPRM